VVSVSAAVRLDQEPETLAARIANAHAGEAAWLDRFSAALDRRRASGELQRVLEVWGLSKAEAGRMFRVTRQAVGKWAVDGVPPDRIEALADLAAATDLLVRYLRRDRIQAVVRRQFDDAGGRSLLDLAREDPANALDHVRRMFDFARVHA
jgi:hypothetical protein